MNVSASVSRVKAPRFMAQSVLVLLLCCAAAILGSVLRPRVEVGLLGGDHLKDVVPTAFGDWKVDSSIAPVLPDPGVIRAINAIYSETLARTYVNSRGQRVMLSLAYGRRQDDSMRLHQPEGCYTGQGFAVKRIGEGRLDTATGAMKVMRLFAAQGPRQEPITYWMVVGGHHVISQWQGKLAQLRFGLRGFIPDGLLVRVSSISGDSDEAYALQQRFVGDLLQAVPSSVGRILTGS